MRRKRANWSTLAVSENKKNEEMKRVQLCEKAS